MSELVVENISRSFGGVAAISEISFTLRSGQTLGVIGPNGAGKSTLINCLQGVVRPDTGSIIFDGKRMHGRPPHRTFALGLARSFQSPQYFNELATLDYLLLGSQRKPSLWGSVFNTPKSRRGAVEDRARAFELLERFDATDTAKVQLGALSYGVRKVIDIARSMMSNPQILLLDEPTSGTAASERTELRGVARDIAASGVGVLVVDHDVNFIHSISDDVLALDAGRTLVYGGVKTVLEHNDVQRIIGFSMLTLQGGNSS